MTLQINLKEPYPIGESLFRKWQEFIQSKNRTPEYIHMHPGDAEIIITHLMKTTGARADRNLLKWQGMRILRSFDVNQNEFFFS